LFELGINYDQYYDLLINNQETKEKELFYNFVTTNKTEFFREPSIFLWIRDNILPPLREQIVSGKKKKIRFWSAGCSSGEEAYSLSFETHAMAGMLSHEKEPYRILATDINTQAIVSAYKGIYSHELIKNLPQSVLNKFFVPVPSNDGRSKLFVIKDFIKNLIQFRVLNFLDEHYPIATQFDIILCRNVLYYFKEEVRKVVFEKMLGYLNPGGYLILSGTETGYRTRAAEKIRPNIFRKTN
jgi:chemotaxis protein methyltransferase CheR